MKPKFALGQKIKFVNDPDSDAGEIVSVIQTKEGFMYSIALKEWDFRTRTVLDARKHILESEAVGV